MFILTDDEESLIGLYFNSTIQRIKSENRASEIWSPIWTTGRSIDIQIIEYHTAVFSSPKGNDWQLDSDFLAPESGGGGGAEGGGPEEGFELLVFAVDCLQFLMQKFDQASN